MSSTPQASPTEQMIVVAARALKDRECVFVGVGQPSLAAMLAKRLHAPRLVMVYESGVIDTNPLRFPLSIGDPALVDEAFCLESMMNVFALYLQRGLIDTGLVGTAQIDRYANLNTTVIGEYRRPKSRLAGSGGACDIVTLAKRTIVLTPHEKRRFPKEVDFVTSPGHYFRGMHRRDANMPGAGPARVITDIGVLAPDETGELTLVEIHPGRTVEEAVANTGWPLKVAGELSQTAPATEEELAILRSLDPDGLYLR